MTEIFTTKKTAPRNTGFPDYDDADAPVVRADVDWFMADVGRTQRQ